MIMRPIEQSCKKCGAAAGDYCKHSNVTKPKTAAYGRFEMSEYSMKAINEWLRMQDDELS
jgi:hypothetical protein